MRSRRGIRWWGCPGSRFASTPIPRLRGELEAALARAEGKRRQIHTLGDPEDAGEKGLLLSEAKDALRYVKYVGDQVIEAFFAGKNDKERKALRVEAAGTWVEPGERIPQYEGRSAFHWEIEFPEVFSRGNPGFDAFLGNPPFAGRNNLFRGSGEVYVYYLVDAFEGAHGSSDLVAYFFRRAHQLLRSGGTMGLIATNTVAQGDTRTTGLEWICEHGGTIYEATRRLAWPGLAAVVVSVVHVLRGGAARSYKLDGREVSKITAFLFHDGGNTSPRRLVESSGVAFVGVKLYGNGFLFDDSDSMATPVARMRELIDADPRNAERIFPYLGGGELNGSPTHAHHRFVIDLNNLPEQRARAWPALLAIAESKVKPEREALGDNGDARRRKANWWHWGQSSRSMFSALAQTRRALACSRVQHNWAVSFLPSNVVLSEATVVFALDGDGAFAVLQCRVHELWARFFGSSMKDDLRYTPSDCFETFPFPPAWQQNPTLEAAGHAYSTFRASLMAGEAVRASLMGSCPPEGLTSTYNRFHDPDETLPGILRLRELHAAMDRAVLDAYGWRDLVPACAFLLDYEEEEDDDDDRAGKKKRKPWRFRWPDEVRDEVLARLLALNAQRAAGERRLGAEAALGGEGRGKKAPKKPAKPREKAKAGGEG